ncbi:hypothetical protein CDAR_57351 [Caerostris darwini]|uniref:Maturase K n=1 Tax=Caerostris darwini TaxID=1538125 RepID=A0AAV4TNW3_9ARAC|nr:hypothetical protein CDAR_57351 [Caerostris darwini]
MLTDNISSPLIPVDHKRKLLFCTIFNQAYHYLLQYVWDDQSLSRNENCAFGQRHARIRPRKYAPRVRGKLPEYRHLNSGTLNRSRLECLRRGSEILSDNDRSPFSPTSSTQRPERGFLLFGSSTSARIYF